MSQLEHHPGAQSSIASALLGFPFRTEFSLAPLIRFWEHEIAAGASVFAGAARSVLEQVRQAPELTGALVDPAAVEAHKDVIDALMTAVFAPTFQGEEHAAALLPFRLQTFYSTAGFKRLLAGPDGALQFRMDADIALVLQVRILNAYSLILERVYGFDLGIEFPWVAVIKDPDTGLDRHFKLITSRRFLDVEVMGETPILTDADLRRVRSHAADPAVLMELLPADRFVIRGFAVVRAIEVTEPEVLSSIERDLIDKESIVSTERFQELQDKMRALFRRPELELGLAAIEGDRVLTLQFGNRFEHACIFADSMKQKVADFAGSIHDRAAREGRPIIIEDLQNYPDRTRVEEGLLSKGYRSVVVAPLFYQGELIGGLKLVSPTPGALNVTHTPQLLQVMPLFAMAVKRSMDELDNRVQAVIKQRCTNIHPAVEWRFRQAVLRMLEGPEAGTDAGSEMEPIIFRDVHPLYALSTSAARPTTGRGHPGRSAGPARPGPGRARGRAPRAAPAHPRPDPAPDRHSRRRGRAADGRRRRGGGGGLPAPGGRDPLRAPGELRLRRARTHRGLSRCPGPAARRGGQAPARLRGDVGLINETILAYLEAEERSAQALSPHFFEMQRTDGVDYSIYAGNALLEDGGFVPLHLKNLRLWQLIVACGIAVHVERVKPGWPRRSRSPTSSSSSTHR